MVRGLVKKSRMSSAKVANSKVLLAIDSPVISGFSLSHLRSGSRVRTKIMGKRGTPVALH